MLRRLWAYRDLAIMLAVRQYQLRYRQSLAGYAWAVVPPLATLVTGTLVFHRVVGVNTGDTPYVMFAMSALAPWGFFASALIFGVPSVTQSLNVVTRLPFPRAVLPLAMIGTALMDMVFAIALFLLFALVTGSGVPLTALWFPALFLIEMLLAIGVVLFASALNVFARDVRLVVPFLVQLWLLLTPVLYPLSAVPPELRPLYLANPMTGLVESFRQILVYGNLPRIGLLLPAVIGAIAFLFLGVWYFGASESRFADVV